MYNIILYILCNIYYNCYFDLLKFVNVVIIYTPIIPTIKS